MSADLVTEIEAPLEVASANEVAWQDRAEVLVVGWGAAGACAALEARAAGASVLVIDRFEGGGASMLSGGVVYAGGGTPQQRAAGYEDSPAAMAEYLRREVKGVVDEATLTRFCDQSVANLAWLESHGARFDSTMPERKTSYPPDGIFLYYSGNEAVPANRGAHPPAPRGHRAVAKGQSGATLYAALRQATLDSGARVLTQSTVRRLVREAGSGRILGAEVWQIPPGSAAAQRHAQLNQKVIRWRTFRSGAAARWRLEAAAIERAHARPVLVRAERGVVMSTGGFIYNRELIARHAPAYARGFKIGAAGCDGSGLRLGQSVGAAADHLDHVSAWRFITPPYSWPKGLVLNRGGERFCNEEVYGATLGAAMMSGQGGKAWLVLDAALRRAALKECFFGGLWAFQSLPAIALMLLGAKKGQTPEDLARRIGADPAAVAGAVAAANAAARGEAAEPFGKSEGNRHQFAGPFYAIDISIGNPLFPLAVLTLGGLRVDETSGQVRSDSGHTIPGLYAAGRSAVGIPSAGYLSGLSLADCVFSGRRAGAAAALASKE